MSDKDQLEHGESSLSGKPGPEKSASVTGGTVLAVLEATVNLAWTMLVVAAVAVIVVSFLPTVQYFGSLSGRSPQNASLDLIIMVPLLGSLHLVSVLFALSCAGLWGAINKPPSASRAASTTLIAVMGLSLLVGWVVLLLIACNVISQMP